MFNTHLSYFIQKNGTPFGHLKLPGPAVYGISKSPFIMPEKLAFQKRLGDGSTVEFYKRAVTAVAS